MKFRVLPVHSAKDATEDFEQLQALLTTSEAKLARLPAAIVSGEAQAEWTAKSRRSAELTVTATGLTTVLVPLVQVAGRGEITAGIVSKATNQFVVQLYDSAEELNIGSKVTFYYMAIGT